MKTHKQLILLSTALATARDKAIADGGNEPIIRAALAAVLEKAPKPAFVPAFTAEFTPLFIGGGDRQWSAYHAALGAQFCGDTSLAETPEVEAAARFVAAAIVSGIADNQRLEEELAGILGIPQDGGEAYPHKMPFPEITGEEPDDDETSSSGFRF